MAQLTDVMLSADVVLFTTDTGFLRVLVVRRAGEPFAGAWALPGGMLKRRELFVDAARREAREETGVDPGALKMVGMYDDPDRDPRGRVITVAYAAVLPSTVHVTAGSDASEAMWAPVASLQMPGALAFDHDLILADAIVVCGLSTAEGRVR